MHTQKLTQQLICYCPPENSEFLDPVNLERSARANGSMLTRNWMWQSRFSQMLQTRPVKSSSCRRQPSCPSSDTQMSSSFTELSVMDVRYVSIQINHKPETQFSLPSLHYQVMLIVELLEKGDLRQALNKMRPE